MCLHYPGLCNICQRPQEEHQALKPILKVAKPCDDSNGVHHMVYILCIECYNPCEMICFMIRICTVQSDKHLKNTS